MIMRELSIYLRVKPIGRMKKEEYHFLADPFSFVPTIAESASGKLFDCSKDITIETPDVDTLREFSTVRSAIVYLRDSSESDVVIGTNDIPALVSISANLNTATLKISCKMLSSPFSCM
jgi:hypothetical protein